MDSPKTFFSGHIKNIYSFSGKKKKYCKKQLKQLHGIWVNSLQGQRVSRRNIRLEIRYWE